MYEEYMQDFFNYPVNGYRNTYDQMVENYPYSYSEQNMFGYNYNPSPYNIQNRDTMQEAEIEDYYPEIYKIVYPMVRKVCSQNNRGISKDVIDSMVEEVYSNIETNEATRLNITLNNDVRGESNSIYENRDDDGENRQIRRNNLLNDLIRILVLRELIRRPGCIGPNCNPRPRPRPPRPNPWQRPPFIRYDFGENL